MLDHEVVQHVAARRLEADFCEMLPEYAAKGHGEGFMHDTAMLLGALGWSAYDAPAEVVTPYFGASRAPGRSTRSSRSRRRTGSGRARGGGVGGRRAIPGGSGRL
jgi:hypothetical protein